MYVLRFKTNIIDRIYTKSNGFTDNLIVAHTYSLIHLAIARVYFSI